MKFQKRDKPDSWYHPFKARAAHVNAPHQREARKVVAKTTYQTEEEIAAEREAKRIEDQMEVQDSLPHSGDRSYLELSEGTYQRLPMRYDE